LKLSLLVKLFTRDYCIKNQHQSQEKFFDVWQTTLKIILDFQTCIAYNMQYEKI
jgi:hypothetical protein